MASQLHAQDAVLIPDRQVSMTSTPVGYFLDAPAESALGCLLLDHPVVGKSQEVERARPSPVATASLALRSPRRSLEGNEARFLWMQLQPVLAETFRQHRHDSSCIVLSLANDDKIVGITEQEAAST